MLVRRDVLRASKAMQEKVKKNEKIKIMRHTEAVSCY
jgi:thioredoxin reductase